MKAIVFLLVAILTAIIVVGGAIAISLLLYIREEEGDK